MQLAAASSPREPDGTLNPLLLDNDLVSRKAVMDLLKDTRYCVEGAGNGQGVLGALNDRNLDLLLIDAQGLEVGCLEAVAALRDREKATNAHLPIIAFLDSDGEGERERYLQAGIDACLSKPIRSAELLEAIQRLTKPAPEDSCKPAGHGLQTLPAVDKALFESLRLLAEIQAAIRAGDVKTIRQTGDSLKSAITSVLAKEAFNTASTLEKTLHEDDLARAQDACQRLAKTIKSLNPRCEEETSFNPAL